MPSVYGVAPHSSHVCGHRRQVLVQLVDEPRLPDSRLAEDDDVLPLAVLRPLPAIDERRQLDVAADEARQASRRDIEPAAHPARLHDAVERHRLAHALQHLRPAVLDHEHPGDQALRRGGDHHRVGLGRALHARRDVRRLAEDLAAVGDHHRPGVHADAHGQARPVAGGEGGVERRHRVDDRQAGADRPFRVVLARRGPAEVDEQPIAEVLGDVAAEARDGAGGGLLVLRDEVAPLLGVELLRERRRADQVAEEHRQLAALAGRQRGFGLGGRRRDAPDAGAAVGSRAPQPPQNFSPGSFDAPHAAQRAASAAPHSAQKRRSGRLSWLQDGQRTVPFAPMLFESGGPTRPGLSSTGRRFVNDRTSRPASGTVRQVAV